ncbi:MAG: DUF4292 domain-containing protein, partial [Muribaculaceae bacterium]|nr:DUF4292 domain-containing protein [Muribaculaceae bacterium]
FDGLLDIAQKRAVIDSLAIAWQPWESVAVNGKLKMAGLPLSPSLKMYMERDRSIMISLRAPFVGEAGRVEIVNDTLLVVNKLNKIYMEEPISKALSYYPGTLSDLQNLLLGRIVIPGVGMLEHGMAEAVDIYGGSDGACTIVAAEGNMLPGFMYGYSVDPMEGMMRMDVLPESLPSTQLIIDYIFFDRGYDMTLKYLSPKKNYQADIQWDEPTWNAAPFDRIKLGGKYRRVDIEGFMKSLK